jgi:hypothetical protein
MGYAAWDATTVRDLLVRVISDKMQEAALGGLGPAVKRRLVALARRAVSGGGTDPAHPMLWLKPGTKPVRRHTPSWCSKTASSMTAGAMRPSRRSPTLQTALTGRAPASTV